jgi:hypothetical protein
MMLGAGPSFVVERFALSGRSVSKRMADFREAMNERDMGHLSRFRLIIFLLAAFNHGEVNVVVDINVFYSDPQARWISADITNAKLKIMHHHLPPDCWESTTRATKWRRRQAGARNLGVQRLHQRR